MRSFTAQLSTGSSTSHLKYRISIMQGVSDSRFTTKESETPRQHRFTRPKQAPSEANQSLVPRESRLPLALCQIELLSHKATGAQSKLVLQPL